jgi:zinc protease
MRAPRGMVLSIGACLLTVHTIAQVPQAPPSEPSQSMKGAVLKGKAPVSEEVLQVKLPRAQEGDLANGAHLMVVEDHSLPTIYVQILIPGAGGYYDPADRPGLASVAAAMMREGTTTRTSQQISEQLETMAASLNVGTGASAVDANVFASSLTDNFDKLLGLVADVLLNPSFPDQELSRYKQRTEAQLIQQRSSPGFLSFEMASRVIYGNHPAARIGMTIESLKAVTRDQLVATHRARFVPDHALVAVAGDISLPEATKKLNAALGVWKKAGAPKPVVQDPPPPAPSKVYLVHRPNSVQTNLVVGLQAINRTSPDFDVLQVTNKILGGGPTGRLFLILREEKGYTYGAGSGLSAPRYRGDWTASTSVRTEVTEPALKELLHQITRMRDERVPDKEFKDARRSMVANFALSLESANGILSRHVTRWLYGLPADYWDRYPERVMAVTPEQVQAAARKYLNPAQLQIVAVGEGGKIRDMLKALGPFEEYDADGKKQTNTN